MNIQSNAEITAFIERNPPKTYTLRNAVLLTGAFLLSAVLFGAAAVLFL